MSARVPPGWPDHVPPPEHPGWHHRAAAWLIDLCPADYRAHAVLARHEQVLARLAARHVEASLEGVARATATLRADLAGVVPASAVEEAIEALELERARLLRAQQGIALVEQALSGRRYVPRL
jgi:hypothetical protein